MSRTGGWQDGSRQLAALPWSWNGQAPRGRSVAVVLTLAAATAVGAVAAISPVVLFVACLATVAAIAITSPAARFAIFVAGGLLVFRGSDQLDIPKLAYLVWVGVSTAIAIARLAAPYDRRRIADIQPLVLASAAAIGALALSLVVAQLRSTSMIDWIRDAAPYGLLAVSPFLAWDGARSRLGSHMEVMAAASGLIASVAFAVEWLGRRGLADLPFATLGSASMMLPALAFTVATAAILSRRPRRYLWVLIAAAVLALLLVTGTRSALVLLVGPMAMLFAHGQRLTRVVRLAGSGLVIGMVVVALASLVTQSSFINLAQLTDRLGSILSLGTNLTTDQSYVERATQVGLAFSTLTGSPLVGVGLGYKFEWTNQFGQFNSTYSLDTGLAIAAKFGVSGVALLAIGLGFAVGFYRRLGHRLTEGARLSFVGLAAIVIAFLPFGNPFEDKGLPLAAAMLIAWALASTYDAAPVGDGATVGQ